MSIRTLHVFSVLVVLAALAPLGGAAGPTFVHNGELSTLATAPVRAESRDFSVYLEAGDVLDASLTWSTMDDLDLAIIPPGGSCAVLPSPELECLAERLPSSYLCTNGNTGQPLYSTEFGALTYTAPVTGLFKVSVQASVAAPLSTIPYTLTIDIDGVGSTYDIGSPQTISYLRAPCRYLP